jgi:hypothetical protein
MSLKLSQHKLARKIALDQAGGMSSDAKKAKNLNLKRYISGLASKRATVLHNFT